MPDIASMTTNTKPDTESGMTPSEQLSERIHQALVPFGDTTSENVPPFKMEHLIAMALHITGAPMTKEEILGWMVRRVAYHTTLLIRHVCVPQPWHSRPLAAEFDVAIFLYNLPIDEIEPGRYSMTAVAAAVFLDGVLPRVNSPHEHPDSALGEATTAPAETEARSWPHLTHGFVATMASRSVAITRQPRGVLTRKLVHLNRRNELFHLMY
jgi:hypothetical protein